VEYTGERMVPEGACHVSFWEHVYRYRFAAARVAGRRVLDLACGEGYGAAALARAGARSVLGVDLSAEACAHARAKYGLETRAGSAEAIPLADGAVDTVVSFETLEHVPAPERFLAECARVLAPGGELIVSTPNRPCYQPAGGPNPFHVREVDEPEFRALLAPRFEVLASHGQSPTARSWWRPTVALLPQSPGCRLPGVGLVQRALRRWLCPGFEFYPGAGVRAAVVDVIARRRDRAGAVLVNPYVLRPRGAWPDDAPAYLVATARRRG
jgi:SAM-dependent methyltransferase